MMPVALRPRPGSLPRRRPCLAHIGRERPFVHASSCNFHAPLSSTALSAGCDRRAYHRRTGHLQLVPRTALLPSAFGLPSDRSSNFGPAVAIGGSQRRQVSTWLPEAFQTISIWGGTGVTLKFLFGTLHVPYWAGFATISVAIRTALLPVVLYGAQTASRFARIVPEVQFLVTIFMNDWRKYRQRRLAERLALLRTNLGSLGGLYKLHGVKPWSVFLSPLLQIPFFMYVSVDLRKIVNGLDPALAQQLVETSFLWIPDLTEPDPWFGLPVLAGLGLYANVELALGRRSLAGPAAGQADTGSLLKDVFQSLAIFMPCFTSQLPAGVQIYVVTSFAFTMAQSQALRTEGIRLAVGLPSLSAPPPEATYAKEFIRLKQLEQKAREIRGDGPLLGKGVLDKGWELSFPGRKRKTTIEGSASGETGQSLELMGASVTVSKDVKDTDQNEEMKSMLPNLPPQIADMPYIHGVSAPFSQLREQLQLDVVPSPSEAMPSTSSDESTDREFMPAISEELMEKANRGEIPLATQFVDNELKPPPGPVKISKKKRAKKGKRPKRRS